MVKLEREQQWLNSLLDDYKIRNHNEIYDYLEKIAKGKYNIGIGVKEFQEEFFINFIMNGEKINNFNNLYSEKLHKKLINLRRKIDPDFMLGFFLKYFLILINILYKYFIY
jgi:hypothetical protein